MSEIDRSGRPLVPAGRLLRGLRPQLLRRQRRRHRRPPGPHREARLPRRGSASTASGCCRSTRHPCGTAATTSPTSSRSSPSTASSATPCGSSRRPTSAASASSPTWSSTTPATSTPGSRSPARAGQPQGRLVRLERRRPAVRRGPHHLRRHRAVELDLGPGPRAVLLAPLLLPPARPQLRQPRGPGGDARRPALLARPRPRRVPPRRRALPLRARRHQRREPPGDPRLPEARSARRSTPSSPGGSCWPRPTSGRPTSSTTSATATSATCASTSRSCPACSWPLRREQRYPITEILAQTPEIPDGCQWGIFLRNHDELHARDGHRRGARLHVRTSTPRTRA